VGSAAAAAAIGVALGVSEAGAGADGAGWDTAGGDVGGGALGEGDGDGVLTGGAADFGAQATTSAVAATAARTKDLI
jgi:hypothetical protein